MWIGNSRRFEDQRWLLVVIHGCATNDMYYVARGQIRNVGVKGQRCDYFTLLAPL